jgi:hypothetical protein
MRVAITFRDQPKHEGRCNERGYTYLSRGEAESLPHFIEFETPAFLNHEWIRNTKDRHILSF